MYVCALKYVRANVKSDWTCSNKHTMYISIYIYIYHNVWNRGMERILQTGMDGGYGTGVFPELRSGPYNLTCTHLFIYMFTKTYLKTKQAKAYANITEEHMQRNLWTIPIFGDDSVVIEKGAPKWSSTALPPRLCTRVWPLEQVLSGWSTHRANQKVCNWQQFDSIYHHSTPQKWNRHRASIRLIVSLASETNGRCIAPCTLMKLLWLVYLAGRPQEAQQGPRRHTESGCRQSTVWRTALSLGREIPDR